MKEFKSFYKEVAGNEGGKCRYNTRLDTYGCGCQHDCSYCYAKSLLNFRNLWDAKEPSVADIGKIERRIAKIPKGSIVRLGGMTDCFQPLEGQEHVTREVIRLLNQYGIGYLIVTKSDMVCEYMHILDKEKAHIQISTTWIPCEKAVSTRRRIAAIEALHAEGFDVAVRLSPYVPQFVDFEQLNSIRCNKIIVEFLRVNHWIKQWLPLDYSEWTVKHAGYQHLPLEKKIEYLAKVTGFDEVSVCEDVTEHYEYWRECVNHDKNDCCNLRK
ncbi:MAG: radical SAM protein [Clostridia bacterium]|nr:radical SAM protein [Clostridia bacterium]